VLNQHTKWIITKNGRIEARHQWLTPVILATQEARLGGSWFKASPGKQFMRLYLENTQHKKELVEWLKW
jgi:hypothetical protein